MEHPDLPGQPIHVRETAVRAYRWSGWREAPEPDPEPEQEVKPRRRRMTTQEAEHGTDAA